MELSLLISLTGILGAGFSSYMGVKVALAEVRGDIKRLDKDVADLERLVARLELPHFNRREDL